MKRETIEPEVKDAASGPARKRGALLLKIWGGAYFFIIIGYVLFLVYGSQKVLPAELQEGNRLRVDEVFIYEGQRAEFRAGDTINASSLKIIQAACPKDTKVTIYQMNRFYHIPYPYIMGLMNICGLFLVLFTFLGDALPAHLNSFSSTVHTDLEEARAAKAEAEALQSQREAMEREIQEEESRLLVAAEEEAKVVHAYILKHQQEESERYLKALEHHLGAEIHTAAEKLKIDVVHQAVDMARELLRDRISDNLQDQMVQKFTRDLKESSLS